MNKKTIKLLLILIIITASLFIYNKVYATNEILAGIDVYDKDGNDLTYMPPQSGGICGCIDSSLNFDDCYYNLVFLEEKNYEDSFTIDNVGTFKKQGTNNYICNITDQTLLKDGKVHTFNFKVKDLNTQKYDECKAYLICFKVNLTNNSNLSVNGVDFVKNGKILLEIDENSERNSNYIVYDKVSNEIRLRDEKDLENLKYTNMGETFTISYPTKNSTGKIIDTKIQPYSGIQLKGIEEDNQLIANTITTGSKYNKVSQTLGNNHKNLQVYDISIERKIYRNKVQPNGKIEISIPINNEVNNSNLVVYRIADDGTKTEYKVTVNSEDDKKYATFETDHFSTYVLAEKVTEVQEKEKENHNTTEEKKEETQHILDDEPKTGVTSNIEIIISIITVISIIGFIYNKKYNKGVK